jgi:hypothetical protein
MEKIIFFSLAIPILVFVIYLGISSILRGFTAKTSNRIDKESVSKKLKKN